MVEALGAHDRGLGAMAATQSIAIDRPGVGPARRLAIYAALTIVAAVMIFPLFWMVSTSLKTLPQIATFPPVWFPWPPAWKNYPDVFNFVPLLRYAGNSILISALYILGNLFSASLVAYGFARLRFPGRSALFTVMISTLMMPLMVRLVPLFLLYRHLGWLDTPLPLFVPAFFGEAFFIFLMHQYYKNIPRDLVEAARIDGCSELRIWRSIMLPLSKPALISVAIFAFQRSWNDFLAPLVFLQSTERKTLSLGLIALTGGSGEAVTYWHLQMAMSTMMVAPMIVIFFFAQRHFVQSSTASGLKG
jgi:ABC-type glycerol-3-phosphate transport system permease component